MPGFFISNSKNRIELKNVVEKNCIKTELSNRKFQIQRNTLQKFSDDKCLVEDDQFIVIVEGYLLNKSSLFEQYAVDHIASLVIAMYQRLGEKFIVAFRGSFSAALYDKALDEWFVYTNHIGDNAVFYAFMEGKFYVASQVNYILDACKADGKELHLCEEAAYQMLTFGFMESDVTYAQEIKRLRGGTYLCIKKEGGGVKNYHTFRVKEESGLSQEEWIDRIDRLFRNAVAMEYAKDVEYGYRFLADLSGGLDSRMNVWTAHELEKRKLLCLTYCKADYLDEEIAKEISRYWGDELLVKPLDDCRFLYDIDEIISMNYGLSLYAGITGGNRLLKSLAVQEYGLEHTGQCGDVIIGSFFSSETDRERRVPSGMYSERYRDILSSAYRDRFCDYELYLLYVRAFQGANCTHLIRQNYTEVSSPFLDVDFIELCLRIPVKMRMNHNLYKQWILRKYPQAAQFRWESINGYITDSDMKRFCRKIVERGPKKLKQMIRKEQSNFSMNPLDYWLAKKPEICVYFDQYYQEKVKRLDRMASSKLQEIVHDMYATGNAIEKMMALTVLGSLEYYFGGR